MRAWCVALAVWAGATGGLAEPDRWLTVDVVSRDGGAVRVRLGNQSRRPLRTVGPRVWGYSNYVKVGFEVAPFPRLVREGRWTEVRPDLDGEMAAVDWAQLDELTARRAPGGGTIEPGQQLELDLPLPPPRTRGNLELVVLARRGSEWLTYRRTVGTRVLLPGDASAGALRGLLLALMGWLAFRRHRAALTGPAPGVAHRFVIGHSTAVLLAASLTVACLHVLHYRELPYTDGANYAVLARSHMEGNGLRSPVIFPGFMTLVPTSREGQVFVMQAPLWPLLLSYAFRVFGPTALVVAATGYLLAVLTALAVWWIAYLASRRAGVGYLAVAFLLTHPTYFAAVSNGSTVSLQGALVSGLVLLMWAPLRGWSAALAGLLAGLGLVARENTVFVALGLAFCWLPAIAAAARRRGRRAALAGVLLAGLACAAVPPSLEAARKAEALGGAGHPVLRATLLYGTSDFSPSWFWRYDDPILKASPTTYFSEHPGALWNKMRQQIRGVFLETTLPSLVTPSPWFIPVVLPWLLHGPASRRAGWSILLALALQAVVGSVSFLHPSYFVVFVPPLLAFVAASIGALTDRLFRSRAWLARAGLGAALGYGLTPLLLNISPITRQGGVTVGDLNFDPRATEGIADFVRANTAPDSVIAFGHIPAALLSWKTHRTVVSYDPAPDTRPGDTEMWRRLDRQLPVDYILLSSFTDTDTSNLLPGFELAATTETRWLRAWLYGRRERPRQPSDQASGPVP